MIKLQGIVPPLITPLRDTDTLDVDGLQRLLEHVILGGVEGVFILGTTGEGPSLSYRLRREMISRTCELVRQRIPVFVGATDTAFVESITLAQHAADAGAAAVVMSTPYYFPAGQTELKSYIRSLVGQLPLPLVLYNMPGLTKVWFETSTLAELASLDQIIGVKDSSGDLEYFERLVGLKQSRPDWSIMMGPEHLLTQSVSLGGDGGVNGGANVCPALFVEVYTAARDGQTERLDRLSQIVNEFQKVYDIGKYASRHIKATKTALSLLGICSDVLAQPFHRFLPPERARVRAILESLEIGPLRV